MSDDGLPVTSDLRLMRAAQWRLRLSEAGVESCPAFEMWLDDSQNRLAWGQVAGCWDFFGDAASEPDMIAARQAALGDAFRHLQVARPLRRFASAAAVMLAFGLAVGGAWWWGQPDQYETARGERRVITLEDGSRVFLDADSLVTVSYRHDARQLELHRGQARFDVARDKKRPFSVVAGDQRVVATGTAFNIDMAGPKVLVTLIEGKVLVYGGGLVPAPAPVQAPREIALEAGEQLAVAPTVAPVVTPVNIQRVTAWTSGQIIFESEALASVVERVNRYGESRIQIEDARIADLKVSGVFNAGDVDGVVEIITGYLPVRAVPLPGGGILLQAMPAKVAPAPL